MVKIRKYREEDREGLVAIFEMNVPEYFGRDEKQDLEHYLDEFAATHFVAEMNGRLCGSGGYVVKENEQENEQMMKVGWLSWYFVDPTMKGEGVGTRLVRHCMDALNEAGAGEIRLNTSQLAEPFFARFGFEETHREKDYWTEGLDLVAMQYAGRDGL